MFSIIFIIRTPAGSFFAGKMRAHSAHPGIPSAKAEPAAKSSAGGSLAASRAAKTFSPAANLDRLAVPQYTDGELHSKL